MRCESRVYLRGRCDVASTTCRQGLLAALPHTRHPFFYTPHTAAQTINCTSGSLYAANFTGITVVSVSTSTALNTALNNAASAGQAGRVILVSPGTYQLDQRYLFQNSKRVCVQVRLGVGGQGLYRKGQRASS